MTLLVIIGRWCGGGIPLSIHRPNGLLFEQVAGRGGESILAPFIEFS